MKYMITMPNGDVYSVPLSCIAESYSNYYGMKTEEVIDHFTHVHYVAEEWAKNNMNWSDVADYAKLELRGEVDFQEGWCNGEAEITD